MAIISVIVPVYNVEKILPVCLDSILNQTYKDYEIIVVDNNSRDNTKEIIRNYQKKDKRIKYIFEGKKGRGSARNAGIRAAKGTILAMTDADCIVPKNWLADISRPIMKENENIVIGYQKPPQKDYWQNQIQEEDWKFVRKSFDGKYVKNIDTKNFAIKTSLMKKLMFNPKIKNLEDFELRLRAEEIAKIRFLPNLKVIHNHKNSFSKIISLGFDRGYWTTKIYFEHKNNKRLNAEPMFESISVKNFIKFPFWMMIQFLKMPLSKSFFIFVWETSWRAGILYSLLKK